MAFGLDRLAVQFVHLHCLDGPIEFFKLEAMEIGCSFAGFFQQTLDGSGIDLADVCCSLDGTAVAEAFDDPHHSGFG